MSNAQRQRKFRQNRDNNPEQRQLYLQKEKVKYQKDKETGKKKCVKDMTTREHRAIRKRWRTHKRKRRDKQKEQQNILTPPESPAVDVQNQNDGQSRQKKESLKKKNKQSAKCYRDNKTLKQQIKTQERKTRKYKKKWLRLKEQSSSANKKGNVPETPRTKTRKLLRNFSNKTVQKTLVFHNALLDQMKTSYKSLANGDKHIISQLMSGTILRKYKMKALAFKICDISTRNMLKKRTSLTNKMRESVKEYFERADVSRVTAGIKRTVTSKKVKKQWRILNDTIKTCI